MPHAPFDLVIYHADCLDGFAAAWAAHKHSPGAEFIPAKYGDDPPDVEGKRVLVVDFSYARSVMLTMHSQTSGLLVLDHHKTATEALAGLDFTVFDMERSGAGITWDELHPTLVRPELIDVEDRDLWRFRSLGTRAFVAGLQARPQTFLVWDGLVTRFEVETVLAEGRAILAFTQRTVEKLASRCYDVKLPCNDFKRWAMYEYPLLAVNCPPEFVSDTADFLKPRAAGRAIVGWYFDGERGDFVFELRSAEDGPDVSEIAQAFGGGGHEHAAGFRLDHNPLVKA